MADFTGYIYQSSFLTDGSEPVGYANSGTSVAYQPNFGTGTTSAMMYLQRQYDLTLNQYVYYKLTFITSSPNPTQTTPNHTNNFKTDSHEVLLKITEVV